MKDLIRPEILAVSPYRPVPPAMVKLDANEVPFGWPRDMLEQAYQRILKVELNRYPDNDMEDLLSELASYTGMSREQLAVGVGSDELIGVVIQTVVTLSDLVLMPSPTFTMYDHCARLFGAQVLTVESDDNFQIPVEEFLQVITEQQPKLTFICSPNNPSGNEIPRELIIQALQRSQGLVVVDEAYFEFAGITVADLVAEYDNLVVLRTLSKAFGLAGLRIGYLISNSELTGYIRRAQPPYHINALSQSLATLALQQRSRILWQVPQLLAERERMAGSLGLLPGVTVYPSITNFILVRLETKTEPIVKGLQAQGISVRCFPPGSRLESFIRFSIGSPVENSYLVQTLAEQLGVAL